jgi:isoleucyl-tRNA synthetase
VRQEWEKLAEIRTAVLERLENARSNKLINASLEARVVLRAKDYLFDVLKAHQSELPALFIVSQVEVAPFDGPVSGGTPNAWWVGVERADGKKCERCWNYSTHVGENTRYPTVCERCSESLAEIERDGSADAAAT